MIGTISKVDHYQKFSMNVVLIKRFKKKNTQTILKTLHGCTTLSNLDHSIFNPFLDYKIYWKMYNEKNTIIIGLK